MALKRPQPGQGENQQQESHVELPQPKPVGRLKPVDSEKAQKMGLTPQQSGNILVDSRGEMWRYKSEEAAKKALTSQGKSPAEKAANLLMSPVRFASDFASALGEMAKGLVEHIRDEPLTFAGMGLAGFAVAEAIYNPYAAAALGVASAASFTAQALINRRRRQ
jgi:hypothetical protein